MKKEEIIAEYKKSESIRYTAKTARISGYKVKRILITANVLPKSKKLDMYESGMSVSEIAMTLRITENAVRAHLPYIRCEYNGENPTKNAINIKKWRQKRRNIFDKSQ